MLDFATAFTAHLHFEIKYNVVYVTAVKHYLLHGNVIQQQVELEGHFLSREHRIGNNLHVVQINHQYNVLVNFYRRERLYSLKAYIGSSSTYLISEVIKCFRGYLFL